MRKRIQLVVQLFKEAGAAVHAMPLLVLAPFAVSLKANKNVPSIKFISILKITPFSLIKWHRSQKLTKTNLNSFFKSKLKGSQNFFSR